MNFHQLNLNEKKALIFIILEWQAFKHGNRPRTVETIEVSNHLQIPHKNSMKIINRLRKYNFVTLRSRMSAGLNGNGYDGSLYGVLDASQSAIDSVNKYLGDK